MRLLRYKSHDDYELVTYDTDDLPPYAILSHTWTEGEEVTYGELLAGTGKDKAGYAKICFCGERAAEDGLHYFWVDTCCINQESAAELSEGINSMFRWYQNATKCYVFLADVSNPVSEEDRDSQLRESRWFTRGWTLQELIAPRCVEFFSRSRERLGDKRSLERQIHEITGISIYALRGESMSHFKINERFSWAANRTTKKPEDKIYSLLGIFDVHMPAIYGEGEQHAFRRLQEQLERRSENHLLPALFRDQLQLSFTKLSKAALVNPIFNVPFERNPRFTGREPELAQLKKMLFSKHRTAKLAITGLGGVGKTQLVIELLYRVADEHEHCSIIWISAVNMESLHQSYLDAAQKLGIAGCEDDKADVKRLVQEHLSKESTGQWLMVFDNADDIDVWIGKGEPPLRSGSKSRPLLDYLPKSKQAGIVFTTRDRKIAVKLAQSNLVDVQAMEQDAAVQLLGKYLGDADLISRPDTSALLLQLTYLPLAIVQAAAYIKENAISQADYLSLLAEQEEEVIDLLSEEFEDDGRYREVKNPVATTWLISFEQIRRRDPLAAEYLSFMACIEPKDIPRSLLPPGTSRKKETDAIGTLTAYSFVRSRPADECLDLHRLVHLATRNWLRKEGLLAQSIKRAVTRLREVFPDAKPQYRTMWSKYLAHASYALGSDVSTEDYEAKTELLWKTGLCLIKDERWDQAEKAFVALTETNKRVLGSKHRETLTSIRMLATIYGRKGRLNESQELRAQVLETRTKVLGPDHLDTLTSMEDLASIFRAKGQLDEAEELEKQVLEMRKRVLGPKHLHTLMSMGNLALISLKRGRLDEAKKLQEQVLEMRKRVLGPEHPATLSSMGNLAAILWKKGWLNEAEELEKQVLETRKRLLGPEHPATLSNMANLAVIYSQKGRLEEAKGLGEQVLEMRKRVLGPEHPDTLSSMLNLSCTWKALGEQKKAIRLLSECVELKKRVLGINHPDCLRACEALSEFQSEFAG